MLSLRHLFPAVVATILAALPAARGAVAIADAQVTNVGTDAITLVWTTSEVSTPSLEVYSDSAGTNAITSSVGLEYYPMAEGDPVLINTTAARAGRRALELLAINRRVVVVRVFGLTPGTTYYVRPRTFGNDGVDNGTGLLPLIAATTAQTSSLVSDGRLVRVRFPSFAAEGMVALVQGPVGTSTLSAIVGDSADADSAVFPLANLIDTASGAQALFSAPQTISIRVLGAGAPAGASTRTISYGTTFNVASYESIDSDLVSPAPLFTTQPANQSVLAGANATFTVAVSGTPTPSVKWQRLPNGSSTWSDLVEGAPYTGTATTTLTVSGATLVMSGDQFRAVATNTVAPDATSNAATLTVNVAPVAPSITTQPANQSVLAGANATFTVATSGTPTPSVKWQRLPNGSSTWSDLVEGSPYTGTATTTLTVSGATLLMSGDQFRAVATNTTAPAATSNAATLTVNVAPVAPSITTQPANQSVLTGANATFTVAVSGTPTPSVKWQRLPNGSSTWSDLVEGAPYTGTATTTLTVTGATLVMSGDQFRAVATNTTAPSATSNAATLTVNVAPVAPSITTQPVNQSVLAGANATFTVAASGTPTPSVKWQRLPNGSSTWSDLVEGAPYTGTATTTLTVTGATLVMSGDQFRAVATNTTAPSATSNAATLTVNVAPVAPSITTQPANQSVLAGANATFTVAASGTPTPSVKWQRLPNGSSTWSDLVEGAPYTGTATTTLTVTGATLVMSGDQFRAVATNTTAPSATSNAATLTVNVAPVAPSITTQPANQSVLAGANATFTVAASGTPTPSVKWQRLPNGSSTWSDLVEGAPYTGTATTTLTVTGATLLMSGDQFRAVATNTTAPSATSNAATLTVNVAPVAPSITTQPANQSVLAGANATFTVAASGTPTPSVKWQRLPNGSSTWSDLVEGAPYTGTTTTTLTVTGATLVMSGDQFRAVATNTTAPSATSNAATLTVNVAPVAPSITTQPANQSVLAGANATFTVAASGTPTPSVKWQRLPNGSSTWSDLVEGAPYTGTATTTLTVTGATLLMSGDQFRAVATNTVAPDATSNAATLTVTVAAVAPSITTQPVNQSVLAGANATFTVAASGTPTPSVKWQRLPNGSSTWSDLVEGAPYTGTATTTLTVTGATLVMSGDQFRAVATNTTAPSATSTAATLTVNVLTIPPAFTTQPLPVMVTAGSTATFTVAVSGTPTPTVKWQRLPVGNTVWADLANAGPYAGVTTTSLVVSGTNILMSGDQFRAIATNGTSPDATSIAATLTVNAAVPPVTPPPVITSQPVSQTVLVGANVSFTVQAVGAPPLSYQWRKNGSPIFGATGSTLMLTNVGTADAGSYVAVVTNGGGSTSSNPASLTVNQLPPPEPPAGAPIITVHPASTTFAPGGSVSLSVSATGSAPLSYQWFKNGALLEGATGATLTIARTSIATAGGYYVMVRNTAGSVTSHVAILSPKFAGTYFGNFGGNRGRFSLYARGDGTGVFLGYANSDRVGLISRNVLFDNAGRFRAVIRSGAGGAGPTISTGTPPRVAAEAEYQIDGVISASGAVSGTVSGLGLTFTAPSPASSGSTTTVAGFYQAGAVGSSATSYAIVGTTGEAFVVTTVGTTVDAGQGTVTATGELNVRTENNARVTGAVLAQAATISATMTPATGAPLTFVGANADVRTQVEKLVNVSTRTHAGADSNTLIAGFVISGTERKQVLVRAIGPTLSRFDVGAPLSAVRLEVFRDGTRVGEGGDWGAASNAAAVAAAAARVGAFELPTNSRDAALLLSLEPGAYTAQVTGAAGQSGVALVEVYDATEGAILAAHRIVNVSTRAMAGAGDNTLIAGFVINGSIPKRVLIRGAGPSLAQFGVSGALARPEITIFSGRTSVASNAGWSSSSDATAIADAASDVGAFAFAAGSNDAAVILNLAPGAYTVQVSGVNDTAGVALIEVYEVP